MDLNEHSTRDLLISLEAETAKSLAEVKAAQADLDKVNSRLRFVLAVIHILKARED